MARSKPGLGDDFLELLRNQADIVRIVSDYVTLKKAGRSWKGLCPFHREKTPSFHVDEAKGLFHCFGCNQGGDVFTFIMRMEGLSFPDAMRAVAQRCGLEMPQDRRRSRDGDDARARLLELNRRAADWYRGALRSERGAAARRYLESRGFAGEHLDTFRIGFAPPGWDNLLQALGRDFAPSEMEAVGLALARRSGDGHYDRFRNRVLFPIRDLRGNVLGFGGRILPDDPEADEQPKYLNTPETPIYHKGKILYAMELARAAARREGWIVLVEGYTDVVALHRHGIEAAAGVCGTALTPEQAALLARFTDRVYVNFDADDAGRSAAVRGLELLLEAGLDVRAVALPAGEDPASFLDREGPDAYRERLDAAKDLLAFFLDGAAARADLSDGRAKLAVVEEVLPLVARVPDRILRSEFASRLAERLRIEDQVILERVRRAVADGRDRLGDDRVAPGSGTRERRLTRAERGLLRSVLDGAAAEALEELREEDVTDLESSGIFREILTLRDEGRSPDWTRLLDRLGGEEDATILSRLAGEAEEEVDPLDCLRTLRRMQLERRLLRVQHQIAAAERAGDRGTVDRLALEKLDLKRRMATT